MSTSYGQHMMVRELEIGGRITNMSLIYHDVTWISVGHPIIHSSVLLWVSSKCVEVSSTPKLLSHTSPMACSAQCLFGLQLPGEVPLEWAKWSWLWGRKPLRDSVPSWISCTHCRKGHECKFWWNNVFFWKTWQFRRFQTCVLDQSAVSALLL